MEEAAVTEKFLMFPDCQKPKFFSKNHKLLLLTFIFRRECLLWKLYWRLQWLMNKKYLHSDMQFKKRPKRFSQNRIIVFISGQNFKKLNFCCSMTDIFCQISSLNVSYFSILLPAFIFLISTIHKLFFFFFLALESATSLFLKIPFQLTFN